MLTRSRLGQPMRLVLCLAIVLAALLPAGLVDAQVEQGATLTVLRGQVAVIHPNGSAVQPAASGTLVNAGDEIRTIGRSDALITFFSGSEIELGADTILVVDRLSRQGDTVDISLKQVLGATLNRVQSIAGSGSSYEIQAGGAVALVRGTTFALVGPVTTSVGDVVAMACREDCTSQSTFAGCAMSPFTGQGVVVGGGKVQSDCANFSVDRGEGLFDAAFEAVTTTEQHFQGDTHGVPAGQVAPGSRQETSARQSQQQAQDKDTPVQPPVASPPPLFAPPVVAQPCNQSTESGGTGTTTTVHELGRNSGTFLFSFDAFAIPDRFQVTYEGQTLLDTGFVSGGGAQRLTYSGSSTQVTVTVIGNANVGTAWTYIVNCPT